MRTCQQRGIGKCNGETNFQTSYERSHYYQVPVPQVLYRARVERKLPEDRTKSPLSNNYMSVYTKEFTNKYTGYQPEHYGRYALRKSSLKTLHEKYVQDLVKPPRPGISVSGSTYVPPKGLFEPNVTSVSRAETDATCPVSAFGRDEFPPVPPNEPGYHKHLDIFVSTAHMTHVNFAKERRNGIASEEAITYYNANVRAPKSY